MSNVIKQIVSNDHNQTIKMVVMSAERGPQGEKGDAGDAATIAIGNTYTLPAGSAATVQNSGSSSAAVFNFGIPKGDKGDKGNAATVEVGTVTTLPAGYDVIVSNSGDTSNAVLNFSIPQGERGPRGYQGEKGDKGDTGEDGKDGADGAIHYTAGPGIVITPQNVIEATGSAVATWGDIVGDITDQADLQNALNAIESDIPTKTSEITNDGSDGTSTYVEADELATVATSGSYSDLSGTPTIPTVNDATLTIQNNGVSVATFSANSSTNATANLIPPVDIGEVISTPTSVDYVGSANIKDAAVTTAKIAGSAVTEAKIATNAVTTTKIGDNAVTTGKIANAAVTAGKIDFSTFTQSFGTSQSYFRIGDLLVYYGSGTITSIVQGTNSQHIAFPQVFADANYSVTVTPRNNSSGYDHCFIAARVIDNTDTLITVYCDQSSASDLQYSYIAIGKGA